MVKKCITSCSVILHRRKILMLRHKKLGKWLFPGGHMEANENPMDTAIRETKEETGLDIKIVDAGSGPRKRYRDVVEPPRPITIMIEKAHYRDASHLHFDFVYLAKFGKSRKIMTQAEELGEFRWFGKGDIDGIDTSEDVKDMMRWVFSHTKAF